MARPRAPSECLVVVNRRTDTQMRGRYGRDGASQIQEMHEKSNIFPRAFKLRYLCDYWELEAEIKTGERFHFVF